MPALSVKSLTPENMFSKQNLWQSWLDVEAALARVQGHLGVIPPWAVEEICSKASVEILGLEVLEAESRKLEAPILALTHVLGNAAGKAGDYVHWGATTQNVMQTGRLMLMLEGHKRILQHLANAVDALASQAEEHADTAMVARTNRQHALPISYGFKVAGWIEELARAVERLSETRRRVFALPFGGAVGAMHAFGGRGAEINRLLAEDLGLRPLLVPSRTVNDLFAEYVVQIALLGMTIERIATELYLLMSQEIGEITERLNDGVVGSSTMPHKINPKRVVGVIGIAGALRGCAAPAMEGGRPSHEGDAASNRLTTSMVDIACPLAWQLSETFEDLSLRAKPQPLRMAENLKRTGVLLASENLMMVLAPHMGRAAAHHSVQHALVESRVRGEDALAILCATTEIRAHMSVKEIARALDPTHYLGESAQISHEAAKLGRSLARAMRGDAAK